MKIGQPILLMIVAYERSYIKFVQRLVILLPNFAHAMQVQPSWGIQNFIMISWLELGETKHNFHQILMEKKYLFHIDGLVQERCNSIAKALELHLSCTNPSIYNVFSYWLMTVLCGPRQKVWSKTEWKLILGLSFWPCLVPSRYSQRPLAIMSYLDFSAISPPWSGLILGLRSANESHRYYVMMPLIGWVQA